jgi:hypothetical protein
MQKHAVFMQDAAFSSSDVWFKRRTLFFADQIA